MTNEETIEKLYDLKLGAMAEAFREMLTRPQDGGLSFAERMGAYSEPTRPPIPIESGHPFRGKAATHSGGSAFTAGCANGSPPAPASRTV